MEFYKLVTSMEERDSRATSRSPSTAVSASPQTTPSRARFIAPGAEPRRRTNSSAMTSVNVSTADAAGPSAQTMGLSPASAARKAATQSSFAFLHPKRPIINASAAGRAQQQQQHQQSHKDAANNSFAARALNMDTSSVADGSYDASFEQQQISPSAAHRVATAAVNFSDPSLYLNASQEEKEAAMRFAAHLSMAYEEAAASAEGGHSAAAAHIGTSAAGAVGDFSSSHGMHYEAEPLTGESASAALLAAVLEATRAGTADGVSHDNSDGFPTSSTAQQLSTEEVTSSSAGALTATSFSHTETAVNQFYSESMDTSSVSISHHVQRRAGSLAAPPLSFSSSSPSRPSPAIGLSGINVSTTNAQAQQQQRMSPAKAVAVVAAGGEGANKVSSARVEDYLFDHQGDLSLHTQQFAAGTVSTTATTTSGAPLSPAAVFLSPEVTHLRRLLSEKLNKGLRAAFEAFATSVPADPILRQLLEDNVTNGGRHQTSPELQLNNDQQQRSASQQLHQQQHESLLISRETAWRRVGEAVAEQMQSALAAGYDALASELSIARAELARQSQQRQQQADAKEAERAATIADIEAELRTALEMNALLIEEANQANALRRQAEAEAAASRSIDSDLHMLAANQRQSNRLFDGETNSRWFCVAEESKAFVRLVAEHNSRRNAIVDVEVRADLQAQFHARFELLKAMHEQQRAEAEAEAEESRRSSSRPAVPSIRGLYDEDNGGEEEAVNANFTPRPPPGVSPRRDRSAAAETATLRARIDAMAIGAVVSEETARRAELDAFATAFRMETVTNIASFLVLLSTAASAHIQQTSSSPSRHPMNGSAMDSTLSPLSEHGDTHHNANTDDNVELLTRLLDEEKDRRIEAVISHANAEGRAQALSACVVALQAEAVETLVAAEATARASLEAAYGRDCLGAFAHSLSALFAESMAAVRAADQSLSDSVAAAFEAELRREFSAAQRTAIEGLDECWTAEVRAAEGAAASRLCSLLEAEEGVSRRRLEAVASDVMTSFFSIGGLIALEISAKVTAIADLSAAHAEERSLSQKLWRDTSESEKQSLSAALANNSRDLCAFVLNPEAEHRIDLIASFATQRIAILAEFFEVGSEAQTRFEVAKNTAEMKALLGRQHAAARAGDAAEAETVLQQREELLEERFALLMAEKEAIFEEEKAYAAAEAARESAERTLHTTAASVSSMALNFIAATRTDFAAHLSTVSAAVEQTVASIRDTVVSVSEKRHSEALFASEVAATDRIAEAASTAERVAEARYTELHTATIAALSERYEERITAQREELLAEFGVGLGRGRNGVVGGGGFTDSPPPASASDADTNEEEGASNGRRALFFETPVKIRAERALTDLAAARRSVSAQRESVELLAASSCVVTNAIEVLRGIAEQHQLAAEVAFCKAHLSVAEAEAANESASRDAFESELSAALSAAEAREEAAEHRIEDLSEELSKVSAAHAALVGAASALRTRTDTDGAAHAMETDIAVRTIEALRGDYDDAIVFISEFQKEASETLIAEAVLDSERRQRATLEAWEAAEIAVIAEAGDGFTAEGRAMVRRAEAAAMAAKAEDVERLVTAVVSNIVDSHKALTATLRDGRAADEAVVRATVGDSMLGALVAALGGSSSVVEDVEETDGETSVNENDTSAARNDVETICAALAGRIAEQLGRRFGITRSLVDSSSTVPNGQSLLKYGRISRRGSGVGPFASSSSNVGDGGAVVSSHSALVAKLDRLEQLLEEATANASSAKTIGGGDDSSSSSPASQLAALKSEVAVMTVSVESSLAIVASLLEALPKTASDSEMPSAASDEEGMDISVASSSPAHQRLFNAAQELFGALHHPNGGLLLAFKQRSNTHNFCHADSHEDDREKSAHLFRVEGQLLGANAEAGRLRAALSALKESTRRQLDALAASAEALVAAEGQRLSELWEGRLQKDLRTLEAAARQLVPSSIVAAIPRNVSNKEASETNAGDNSHIVDSEFESPFGAAAHALLTRLHTRLTAASSCDAGAYAEAIESLRAEKETLAASHAVRLSQLDAEARCLAADNAAQLNTLRTDLAVSEERIVALQSALSDATGRYESLFAESGAERSTLTTRIDTLMSEKLVDASRISLLETEASHLRRSSEQSACDAAAAHAERVAGLEAALATEKANIARLEDQIALAETHERSLSATNAALRTEIETVTIKFEETETRLKADKTAAIAALQSTHEKESASAAALWEEKVARLTERVEEAKTAYTALYTESQTERSTNLQALQTLRTEHAASESALRSSHETLLQTTVKQLNADSDARIADLRQQLEALGLSSDSTIATLRGQLEKVTSDLEAARAAFSALSEEHAVLKEGPLARLRIGEEALNSRVAELLASVEEGRALLAAAEAEAARLRDRLAESERRGGEAEAGRKEAAARLESCGRERDMAHEQLSRLEQQLSELTSEVSKVRRSLHTAEMELSEVNALFSGSQAALAVATSERQEMHSSKLELERQLLEIHASRHSDLEALQLRIGSLSRRIMDEERRNGDLHRRCVEKDASMKRLGGTAATTVATASTMVATTSHTYASAASSFVPMGLLQSAPSSAAATGGSVAPLSPRLLVGGTSSPSPIPTHDHPPPASSMRLSLFGAVTPTAVATHSVPTHRSVSAATSLVAAAAPASASAEQQQQQRPAASAAPMGGRYASIARDIQIERLRSSMGRSPSQPTATSAAAHQQIPASLPRGGQSVSSAATSHSPAATLLLGSVTQNEASSQTLLQKMAEVMGSGVGGGDFTDDVGAGRLGSTAATVIAGRGGSADSDRTTNERRAGGGSDSHSPDARLYFRYSASPDAAIGGDLAATVNTFAGSGDGANNTSTAYFSKLRQLAITGGASQKVATGVNGDAPSFAASVLGGGKAAPSGLLRSANNSASPMSSYGPSTSPPLSEQQ